MPEKQTIVGEIAFEKSAWFFEQAVGPFDTTFLDPSWGLFDFAGVEGEGGADAEVDGGRELVFVLGDPAFLFRAAEAYPDEVSF